MKLQLKSFSFLASILVLYLLASSTLWSQGVTTSAISGVVTDKSGQGLPGANVVALHVPSGTTYGTTAREDGSYALANLRAGGPYTLAVSYVGYRKQEQKDITLQLSQTSRFDFQLVEEAVQAGEVLVTGERSPVLNASRTGAATAVSREAIQTLPTISRRIEDITRLTPQAAGFSFAGQDNRLNNVTIDGSFFNDSFGLGNQPGDRTGVAPISLDAIEQIQVNIAPFDVRQGHFIGAGVNTVTKSGTNEFSGSAYYQFRTQGLVGQKAGDVDFNAGTFKYNNLGIRLGGPIIENQLFFFTSFENDALTNPGTTYTARTASQSPGGTTTRVLASDMDQLSTYLMTNFNYDTGPYQGYDFKTPATRFLARLDYNLDERNKVSLRYIHLNSEADILVSNSSSLGFGNRRSSINALNFANSNYGILDNIRSIVGEWNSVIGEGMANNFILGYSYYDQSRSYRGSRFPLVDILASLADQTVYTTFGFEPFTPNNELRFSSTQIQDNLTIFGSEHTMTFGASLEKYHSDNVFFPGSQSVYVYNSLADFYTDANGYLANPNRVVAPVTLRRFQVRWNNIPGQDKPLQPLDVYYTGVYAQDEWQVTKDLRLTLGLRIDVPFFGNTGYDNALADTMTFMDEGGNPVKYNSGKLPDPHFQFSPRFGFNWDVMGDRTTQLRGGSGLFSGPPLYVWISNQIGNTGVLTGFLSIDNTTAYPFNPNPDKYKPTTVTGAPATSYELALTDPNFKFPQLWRTNFAVDQKLPFDMVGTVEFIYSKDVNGIYYIDASLKAPNTAFVGADNRPRWNYGASANRRINGTIVQDAIVLKNQDVGTAWTISASLERPFADGFYGKIGYNYGESKNTVDPGSIAFGSWNNNQHAGYANNPGLGFSSSSPGQRIFAALTYRAEYFDFGGTTVSLFWQAYTPGNGSYVFGGDMNGDGGTSNDLIYIPKDQSEMNFQQYTSGTVTFTAQQQMDAWDAFINQDPYLSKHRGQYAERGGVFLPTVYRADLSISQDVFTDFLGKRNTLQLRADILNVGNFLNKSWGVGQTFTTTSPLQPQGVDAQGRALYRLRALGTPAQLISQSFTPTATTTDVYRVLFSIRYIFN